MMSPQKTNRAGSWTLVQFTTAYGQAKCNCHRGGSPNGKHMSWDERSSNGRPAALAATMEAGSRSSRTGGQVGNSRRAIRVSSSPAFLASKNSACVSGEPSVTKSVMSQRASGSSPFGFARFLSRSDRVRCA